MLVIQLREILLPIVTITVILGYHLSIYFIFQYHKHKKENLPLNKNLLALGLFFNLVITSYMLQGINIFFVTETFLIENLQKIGILLFFFALIEFLILNLIKSFNEILNSNLIKILIIVFIIELIFIFFFNIGTIFFIIIFLTGFIGSLYILIYQLKLIKYSIGDIRKRLMLILIGEILIIGSIIIIGFIRNILSFQGFDNLIYLTTTFLIFISIIIIFVGVNRFPPFLDFNWKKYLLKLYIFEQENYKLLFEFDFTAIRDENNASEKIKIDLEAIKSNIFSRGIVGIDDFTSKIMKIKNENIKKIKHGEALIFLDYGDEPMSFITYALLVDKDIRSMSFFLKEVKEKFQELYKNIILHLNIIKGTEDTLFFSFNTIIKEILK